MLTGLRPLKPDKIRWRQGASQGSASAQAALRRGMCGVTDGALPGGSCVALRRARPCPGWRRSWDCRWHRSPATSRPADGDRGSTPIAGLARSRNTPLAPIESSAPLSGTCLRLSRRVLNFLLLM